jgi:tRNA U34 5-methylaminomethyl-2-thiouridine-forming methyltransferase MnmC
MKNYSFVITGDGSHTIYLPDINETYHSTHGAIRESNHVFIKNGLEFIANQKRKSVSIYEVGFGTGLNALLTALYAERNQITIRYQSIDAFPLDSEDIYKLNYIEKLGDVTATAELFQRLHLASWENWHAITPLFQLKKIKGLFQETEVQEGIYDLCYFDAFAPSKQPEMWEISILEKIKNMLVEHGVFTTYCAKGQLKRDLKNLGFEVETLEGPPGKKEMVRAIKI